MYHPQILILLHLQYINRESQREVNSLSKKEIVRFFLLESFVDKTTFNSHPFDKINDFLRLNMLYNIFVYILFKHVVLTK